MAFRTTFRVHHTNFAVSALFLKFRGFRGLRIFFFYYIISLSEHVFPGSPSTNQNWLYSAFWQKFPKLWTSVAHSFLHQIAQNKNWAHPKATTLPRICKVEMEQASLLYYSAKPQSGGISGCALRRCTSEPFDSRRFVEASERTERTHSTLRGHAAIVVPMFRVLIMIALVDRHGRVALRSEILGMPFFHLFDFFNILKCSHRFRLQAQNDHWCDRPSLAKNSSLPLLMIQRRQDTHPKNWNYALKLK